MSDDTRTADDPAKHGFIFPARAHYDVTAGYQLSSALLGLVDGQFIGQVSRVSGRVYMPPLGACPISATPTTENVDLPNKGTIITFCIVNLPIHGSGIDVPFACADIMLDGSDTTFLGLIQECDHTEVEIGMRVEAVWKDPEERTTNLSSIRYFRPIDEPTRDIDELRAEREKAWERNRAGGQTDA